MPLPFKTGLIGARGDNLVHELWIHFCYSKKAVVLLEDKWLLWLCLENGVDKIISL